MCYKKWHIVQKEFLRKSIHMGSALVPLALSLHRPGTLVALAVVLVLYCLSEYARLHGHTVPLVSALTAACARTRDQHRFVLGPVTLCFGVFFTALVFPPLPAMAGIFSLAFGDGSASLAGILFGRTGHPFTRGKTVVGSLACFTAVLLTVFFTTGNAGCSFIVAVIGCIVEGFPLGDWDNLILPAAIAGAVLAFCPPSL